MSATFDEEHLNHSTSFLQPLGTLRSSSPQLVRFGEMARLPKINQQQVIVSETTMPRILQLQQGPGDVPLESETPRVFTGDLGTGGQVPACKWTVVMLQYANNSHRKEPKLHSIARLNITLAV